jgi:succinate dehydrogenase / fumarate reductase iron-sulfur subunit
MYRHACHHASCGTCAVRINGYERLPCIVSVKGALAGRTEIVIEPLRNFPLVGDLVVDMGLFFQKQAASTMAITRPAEPTLGDQPYQAAQIYDDQGELETRAYNRFENCVECGICLSACPTMAATDQFFGPAGLAGVYRAVVKTDDRRQRAALLDLVDTDHGVWQCRSAWECTEACPQGVRPAEAIMGLRRMLAGRKVRALFGRGERE